MDTPNCPIDDALLIDYLMQELADAQRGDVAEHLSGCARCRERLEELQAAQAQSQAFLLQHKLFRSDHTGEVIDKKWLMLSYPSRWKYDILRALDYFQSAKVAYDPRMQDALDVLKSKQRKDHTWPVQAKHPGQTHFDMEQTGSPSRWNTLRALRVLKHFGEIE